ncbi:hypothetical protein ACSTI9_00665, partial [Vibrio parahaemolyticus]
WAEQFLAANYEKRFGANIDARRYLRDQIEELRERLARSEKELVDYANANQIVIVDTGVDDDGGNSAARSLIGDTRTTLNEALAQATAER